MARNPLYTRLLALYTYTLVANRCPRRGATISDSYSLTTLYGKHRVTFAHTRSCFLLLSLGMCSSLDSIPSLVSFQDRSSVVKLGSIVLRRPYGFS